MVIVTPACASGGPGFKDNNKSAPRFLSGEEIRKPGGESIYYVTCGSDIPAAAIEAYVPSVSPVRSSSSIGKAVGRVQV